MEINFGRFELTEPLTQSKGEKLARDESLKIIQTRDYVPDTATLNLINEIILKNRPKVAFRVYGHDSLWNEIPFVEKLGNLEKLQWESKLIESVEILIKLKKLSSVSIGEGQQKPKISLKPLQEMQDQLSSLCISGDFKDQEVILELKNLKSLTLMSTKIGFLKELKDLRLEHFGNYGSRIVDLTSIGEFKELKTLWIKNHKTIMDIDFISELTNLEELSCEYLSNWTTFPSITNLKKLNRILILTCNKLVDIEVLKNLPNCKVRALGSKLPNGRFEKDI